MNEDWRDVVGFEGKYKVSNSGEILSMRNSKKRRLSMYLGYNTILLRKDGRYFRKRVSRLVYEAFHGAIPEGMVVDHIDRNRINNQSSNLRCVSPLENQFNRVARRTFPKGNKWGYATRIFGKLYLGSGFINEEDAYNACKKLRSGYSI